MPKEVDSRIGDYYDDNGNYHNFDDPKEGMTAYVEHRNNFRMPASHLLSVGVNFHKKKKHCERIWNFSVVTGDHSDYYYKWDNDLIYGDEVILKDDILSTPSIDFSSENPFEQEGMYKMRNHFHIFSDMRFAGNKCDMSVVKKGYVGSDTYPCHEENLSDSVYVPEWFTAATVLIDCLSESCYRYLKMANGIVMGYYRDYDALIDPIKMPSNVHGGSGTIGIITRNSKRIVLYDHYRPKPVYAPDRQW